jgi:hypothetical protein
MLKKLEMKVVAVNAMARPKTMPIPRRSTEPPSENAKPRPVRTIVVSGWSQPHA